MGALGALFLVLSGILYAYGARPSAGRLALIGIALAVLGPSLLGLGMDLVRELPAGVVTLLIIIALIALVGAWPNHGRSDRRPARPTSAKSRVERD